jgi:hypothetical protein
VDEQEVNLRLRRARAQAVGAGIREESVDGVLSRVVAVQAQDPAAAALGLRVRAQGVTAAEVTRALTADRTIVRSWFLRGTLHLVRAVDARWLLELLGPVFLARSARRYRDLGLDAPLCIRAERLIVAALDGEGPLTRRELTERLAAIGVAPTGQAAFHLLRRAALAGLVCYGPERHAEPAFVLLDAWLPEGGGAGGQVRWTGDAAVAELARRYRAGYGPTDVEDFAAWSGLRLSDCRRVWTAGGAADTVAEEGPEPGGEAAEPDVRLLPAYDNYLVGYRDRSHSVPAAYERRVWPGGGQIRPTVLRDGWAAGTWSRATTGELTIDLWPGEGDGLATGIAAETADLAQFHAEAAPGR